MRTPFGKYMRIQRALHDEVQTDTARLLGVSSAFLSAVENGKKQMPDHWLSVLADHYRLSDPERLELERMASISKTFCKIDTSHASIIKRQAAWSFSAAFDTMSDATAAEIIQFITVNNPPSRKHA